MQPPIDQATNRAAEQATGQPPVPPPARSGHDAAPPTSTATAAPAGTSADGTSATGATDAGQRRKWTWRIIRVSVLALVVYFLILPQVPGFRQAASDLSRVQPALLVIGFGLVMASIVCYSGLTLAALDGRSGRITHWQMFRIQMSTRAVANTVPGGTAAGTALGFRLLTRSGVRGTDAGFALATAGISSAIILNVIFWMGLLVSIPMRGVNRVYLVGAVGGVVLMMIAALLMLGLMHGRHRSEAVLRWTSRHLRIDEDRASRALHHLGERVEDLVGDRALLRRVVAWSIGQWVCDLAALRIFIRAFGDPVDLDALVVAFGLANIAAAIPITPGGLGVVEGVYITTLVGFGLPRATATLGVASYRIAQYLFPIGLGALSYVTLRVGPWRTRRH